MRGWARVWVVAAGLAVVATSGCAAFAGSPGPAGGRTPSATASVASAAPSGTRTPSATSPGVRPTALRGVDSANVESVTMSIQITYAPRIWVLDLAGGRAYIVGPDSPTNPSATSAVRSLSATEVADFRATLDAAGVWSWQDWADANRVIAPAGNTTVTLTSSVRSAVIFLGCPGLQDPDGRRHDLPGWDAFYDAVIALLGE